VDSDLTESISALKESLRLLDLEAHFGQADPRVITQLKERFGLPRRYLDFLAESNPVHVETVTPAERIQFISAADLVAEQADYCLGPDGQLITKPTRSGWRPSWFIVARSGLLGDPYFIDTTQIDAEGDSPVYTAMSGTEVWQPKLCASSFAMFVKVLAVTLEVAEDFDLDDYDPDNERVFREAIGPRIREVDAAAQKAGHWT
jgi:hypothetical protein